MENERQRLVVLVAAIAIAGLLLSCVAGALAGGVVGLLAGRQQARLAAERALTNDRWEQVMPWSDELPMPMPEFEATPFAAPEPGVEGARIVAVVPGAAAEAAGLQPGDVIVAVDDVPVDRNHPLSTIVAQYRPGDKVTVELSRAGERQAVDVTLGENPDDPSQPYLGVRFRMNLEPDYNLPGG